MGTSTYERRFSASLEIRSVKLGPSLLLEPSGRCPEPSALPPACCFLLCPTLPAHRYVSSQSCSAGPGPQHWLYWEVVRNAEAQAPPKTYRIRICILPRAAEDSYPDQCLPSCAQEDPQAPFPTRFGTWTVGRVLACFVPTGAALSHQSGRAR